MGRGGGRDRKVSEGGSAIARPAWGGKDASNPCYGCTAREPGCHDRCAQRDEWLARKRRAKENERRYRAAEWGTAESIARHGVKLWEV
nr:MAG TPA: hypothetical protein [Caudoviricetes sp.]